MKQPTSFKSISTLFCDAALSDQSTLIDGVPNGAVSPCTDKSQILMELLNTQSFNDNVYKRLIHSNVANLQAADQIGKSVKVTVPGPNVLRVSVSAPDPTQAMRMTSAVVAEFLYETQTVLQQRGEALAKSDESLYNTTGTELAQAQAALSAFLAVNPRATDTDEAALQNALSLAQQAHSLAETNYNEAVVSEATAVDPSAFHVIDPAGPAEAGSRKKTLVLVAVGALFGGLVITILSLVIVMALDDTVRDESDLQPAAVVVGVVPLLAEPWSGTDGRKRRKYHRRWRGPKSKDGAKSKKTAADSVEAAEAADTAMAEAADTAMGEADDTAAAVGEVGDTAMAVAADAAMGEVGDAAVAAVGEVGDAAVGEAVDAAVAVVGSGEVVELGPDGGEVAAAGASNGAKRMGQGGGDGPALAVVDAMDGESDGAEDTGPACGHAAAQVGTSDGAEPKVEPAAASKVDIRPPEELVEACRAALRRLNLEKRAVEDDLAPSSLVLSVHRSSGSIGLSSCIRGEGRTTVALGFAAAIHQAYRSRVVLVELDLANPSLGRLLDIESSPGVADIIRETASVEECLHLAHDGSVGVIVAGDVRDDADRLFFALRAGTFMQDLSTYCDIVVADLPPVLAGGHAPDLRELFSVVVLVVRPGVVPTADLRRAVNELDIRPPAVLNGVESSLPARLRALMGKR